jgi:hypothetical protein
LQHDGLLAIIRKHSAFELELPAMQPAPELSAKTPILTAIGSVFLTGGITTACLAWNGSWLGPFFCLTMFGGSGAALLLMTARITADEAGITVRRLFGERHARWEQIAGMESGGGNLVIRLRPRGRLVGPSFEFWSGPQKHAIIQFIGAKLAELRIEGESSVRAVFQAGDR